MTKYKRRNYLPKKSFQIKLLFKIYLSIFIIVTLLSGTLYYINQKSLSSFRDSNKEKLKESKQTIESFINRITVYQDEPHKFHGLKAISETSRIGNDINRSLKEVNQSIDHSIADFQRNMSKAFIGAVIIALVMVLTIFLVLSHRIAGPIFRFEKTLIAIRDGDLSVRINLRNGDELIELAQHFNAMTNTLNEKINKIQTLSSGLKSEINELDSISDEEKEKLNAAVDSLNETAKQFKIAYN